jgi:hypothetical protein
MMLSDQPTSKDAGAPWALICDYKRGNEVPYVMLETKVCEES